ncbi:arginine N-succinyltransferase [Marinobacterium arenosum]|uniref:arginine N-succinyltransferase n=1 Tax=Marinobacterium arenosum TaxID=2862496 RepID=UPI001C98C5B1|nr:arginine N-succinyltransferase [Marinobacterium arenosum]MBY4676474.1 arginine N-succinyltransferase [Marinobacterium arenosum]
MNVIRPIDTRDLDTLQQIARESGPGFTSLPDNRELLVSKIEQCQQALAEPLQQPGPELYLFVLEDSDSGEVLGCCGIAAAVGLESPWYHYRIGTVVHACRELGVHNEFRTLYLCNDYTGCSEVCTLYLREPFRRDNNGGLLSKSRFLFMAEHPQRFAERVIAEMRGYCDEQGRSPFWEGLGRRFFSMDYSTADYLTGSGQKSFIAELMPKYTLYTHLLPEPAQQVIGRVHKNTEPARRMLEQEGFRFEQYVDIFDAGPTLTAPLQSIRAVQQSHYAKVRVQAAPDQDPAAPLMLVANTGLADFRCALLPLQARHRQITLSRAQAEALKVGDGGQVRLVPLKGVVPQ